MIEYRDVSKHYPLEAGFFARSDDRVYAVNGISFTIQPGEIYGLVGESGCGKTTSARLLVRMERLTAGEIVMTGRDGRTFSLPGLSGADLKELRTRVRYIFQDPARSLNPRLSVRDVLLSGYRYAPSWPGRAKAEEEAAALMREVGLQPEDLDRRPADFSGGQRQRISVARALITQPEVLICDEVVSALDVSIQGQILNLLLRLREERNLTMLFIAHDLAVVGYVSDRIGVMYRGVLVEEAPAQRLLGDYRHPYTRYLFDALPVLGKPFGAQSVTPDSGGSAAGAASQSRFAKRHDPTIPPLKPGTSLTMREVAPGHRVNDAFLEDSERDAVGPQSPAG